MNDGLLRRHNTLIALLQRLLDAILVFGLLYVLCNWKGVPFAREYQIISILAVLLSVISLELVNAYRPWRGAKFISEVNIIILGWLLVVISLLVLGWSFKFTQYYSRLVIGWWFVLTPLVLAVTHVLLRRCLRILREQGRNTRSAVIVGAGELGKQLAERISRSPWTGVGLRGFFDDDSNKIGKIISGVPVVGAANDVSNYVKQNVVDYVYIVLPMRAEKRMRELFDDLQDTTASVFLLPDVFIFELMGYRIQDIAGLPIISLCETPVSGPFGLMKKIEDLLLSSIILILISPLMLLIALGVKFSSPGPVIFKQRRYGLHGEEIKVYKFRSMNVCEDGDKIPQAEKVDTRVTEFGALLRKTSLDELPQFFNVLQGRMSVVGPRPHALAHNEEYRKLIKGYMWRHKVKPGITGLAQVRGCRGETDTLGKMEKRVEYDLAYIRDWSIWLDIKIIFLTISNGFTGKNVY